MDWQKNRLYIGVAVLALLGGGLYWGLSQRTEANEAPESTEAPTLPTLDREAITSLEITRPDHPTIRLEKSGETWRMVAPVEADADQASVSTALDKLAGLDVQGVAARNAANHERLEVDPAHGIRVVAHAGEGAPLDIVIGSFRGGNSMVLPSGQDVVLSVAGSIKYAFDKDPKDFRDRRVVDVAPTDVADIQWHSPDGDFHFLRSGEDWAPAEGQAEIERFGSSKVQSAVATFARMRAVDFADDSVNAAAAGLDDTSPTVTFLVRHQPETPDGGVAPAPTEETITLHLGHATPGNAQQFYVQREGSPLIYVVSSFLAERMHPDASKFQNPVPGSPEASAMNQAPGGMPGMPGMPGGMPQGMPGMPGGGGGGGQIPPELMQQIQRQLQQQAAQQAASMH